jgi:hypothetical protein
MKVLDETIEYFVQQRFLSEESTTMLDDLIRAIELRGFDPGELGLDRTTLEKKLLDAQRKAEERGSFRNFPVQPQAGRKESRQRLDERVRAAAKQLLNELGFSVAGYDLPRLFPGTGSQANLPVAVILLNLEVQEYLGVGGDERGDLSKSQLDRAHDNMDEILDHVAAKVRERSER